MPAYEQKDVMPTQTVIIHFMCLEDVREFADKIGVSITRQTKSAWYPDGVDTVDKAGDWEWADES